jgi:hypothetical protein
MDAECKAILKGQNEHNHPTDDRKLERQQVRVSVKRKATDISTRPAKIIRQTLCTYSNLRYLCTGALRLSAFSGVLCLSANLSYV